MLTLSVVMSSFLALAVALVMTAPLAPGSVVDVPGRTDSNVPFFGVQFDVGAPDGIGASAVLTPFRFLRLQVGGLTNGVGSGVRMGVMLLAFPRSPFRPLLGVDGGYVYGGLGPWLPQLIDDPRLRAWVTGLSVGFVNAQVGFELGSKHVALTLRVGLSYIDVGLRSQTLDVGVEGAPLTVTGIAISGFIPSARLGVLFCFG